MKTSRINMKLDEACDLVSKIQITVSGQTTTIGETPLSTRWVAIGWKGDDASLTDCNGSEHTGVGAFASLWLDDEFKTVSDRTMRSRIRKLAEKVMAEITEEEKQ